MTGAPARVARALLDPSLDFIATVRFDPPVRLPAWPRIGVERQVLWLIGHDMSPTLVFDYVVPDRSDNFNALRAVVQRAFVMDAAVVL